MIYKTMSQWNAPSVKAALQRLHHHLKLGTQRLWRCVDRGPINQKEGDRKVYKVFVTYSTQVPLMLQQPTSNIYVHK